MIFFAFHELTPLRFVSWSDVPPILSLEPMNYFQILGALKFTIVTTISALEQQGL